MKCVWYIRGEPHDALPTLFATKLGAEAYARQLFPDEDPDTRYARIYFINLWEEGDDK
jgi:hypothetical protein